MFEQLDIPMARKVLEFAETSHEGFTHDQRPYYQKTVCGTSACLAGIAVMLCPEAEIVEIKEDAIMYGHTVRLKGHAVNWSDAGKEILGLSHPAAAALFHCPDEADALDRLRAFIEHAETEQLYGATCRPRAATPGAGSRPGPGPRP